MSDENEPKQDDDVEVISIVNNDTEEKLKPNTELRKKVLKHIESDGMNLVQKLVDLGYFTTDENGTDENSKSLIFLSHISSPEKGCITMKQLIEQIKYILHSQSSCEPTYLETLAYQCSVDILHIENALRKINTKKESKISYLTIKNHEFMKIGNAIYPSLYLDKLMHLLNAKLNSLVSSYSSSTSPLLIPGRISLSDISLHLFHLPLDITKQIILKRLTMLKGFMAIDNDRQDIISYEYEFIIRRQIHGIFRACSVPVSLHVLQKQYKWPSKFLIPSTDSSGKNTSTAKTVTLSQYVFELCKKENELNDKTSLSSLPGEFNLSNKTYTPFIFKLQQRQAASALFKSHGYISESQAQKLGITISGREPQLLEYIWDLQEETNSNKKSSSPTKDHKYKNILKLPKSNIVFNADVILSPLFGVILEAESNHLFVDFRTYLPDVFHECCNEQDIQFIVDYCIQAETGDESKKKGAIITAHGEILYISPGMINDLNEKILPPLIDEYATTKANQIYETMDSSTSKTTSSENEIEEDTLYNNKEGKKEKKKKKKDDSITPSISMKKLSAKEKRSISAVNKNKISSNTENLGSHTLQTGVIPLTTIALAIAKSYPYLSDIQCSIYDNKEAEINSWSDNEILLDVGNLNNKPILYAIAKRVINVSRLNDICTKAIQNKYQKLRKSKLSTMKSSAKKHFNVDIAKSIEDSFENLVCFPNACYLIQIIGKSFSLLQDSIVSAQVNDTEEISINDMLARCASYFAWRITEFCLFKHNIDTKKITFTNLDIDKTRKEDLELHDDELPLYYEPVDMGMTTFPRMYLSCNHSNSKDSKQNALLILRDELPKEIGAAISNMWLLCGKQYYQGGEIESEDGIMHKRSGSFAEFLTHVEDYCLTMCGLPFKILEKKTEKKALLSRRTKLKQSLENAEDPKDVLELTVLILFQQVKHMALTSSLITSTTLNILLQDKKISTTVRETMQRMADSINNKSVVEFNLVELVRSFGLCKDISKYEK